jgi:1-acyl-sn-glycerol-3-phosphate acyltransferase
VERFPRAGSSDTLARVSVLRALVSIVLIALVCVYTAVMSVIVISTAFLLWPVDRNRRIAYRVVTFWGYSIFQMHPLWKIHLIHPERSKGGPYVVCVNHQSYVDPFALMAMHPHWKWVAKSSLFLLPFFGWAMKSVGNISVVRGERSSGEMALERCRAWLDRGVGVLLFPEGTRSKDLELQPFKHGAFTLALKAGVPILPIVLDGTGLAMQKGGFDVLRGADVTISVLELVDTSKWRDNADGLKDHVRAMMLAELNRIRGEVRPRPL